MANSFQYADWMGNEALRRLTNKLTVTEFMNSDFSKQFSQNFAVGETVRIPMPQRYRTREGLGYSPQPIDMRYTTAACNQVFGVDFEWDSVEKALKMPRPQEYIRENIINPAMDEIAQQIDSRAALFAYQNTNNIVGVLGTDPSSFTTVGQIRQRLIELACPPSMDKGLIISPSVNTSMVGAAIQYFNPSSDISKQYREGSIGRNNGFDWYESMSLYDHVAGTWAGAVTVTSAPAQGATSLVVTCTTGDTFKKGDVIDIDAVFPVNPSTRRVSNSLVEKQFVIKEDATGASSTATLQVYPAFEGPGSQYQNITALPIAGAALTLFPGTSSPNAKHGIQSLALHRDAFAIVGVKFEEPTATEITTQKRDPDSGIYVRFVRMFDPQQSKMINRFDVCMGFGALYADNCAVRLLGA